ncbi:DUF5518 domain-containing protein [Halobium salinum]|uniref:DUF5518 domain-containing protein n=1 Tax=Halobium salinum TaxID=1364940 RepID=A0ABD5PBN6_9EURY|nr:DUF5518 domain-containing protein [Halobium salinum]
MNDTSTRTARSVLAGLVVGFAAWFVPVVALVAPLLGGGVAGYLERAGAKRGALIGALTGVLLAVVTAVLTTVGAFLNLGTVPFENLGEVPLAGLLVGGVLTVVGFAGSGVVAAVGGALGGTLEADHRVGTDDDRTGRTLRVAGSLVAGLVTFGAVAVGTTAVLDPYIWPSLLVGLPVGAVAGVAVAVLGYHYLPGRVESRRGGRTA